MKDCLNLQLTQFYFFKKFHDPESRIVKFQLAKSVTSSGLNYEESQAASSNADFSNKINILFREMRESNYWFIIISETKLGDREECKKFINESDQLKKILGSISSKLKRK